ncbi:unnamed protein product [Arabidopsis lyrata]|nr:unnamed protein product [Arabidopsis lyrata]
MLCPNLMMYNASETRQEESKTWQRMVPSGLITALPHGTSWRSMDEIKPVSKILGK